MGQDFLADYLARRKGEEQATEAKAATPTADLGPFGGFAASAVSAIPELFGFKASDAADEFRNKYPIAGVVSEIAPTLIPYAGWAKATELPALANALERTVARTGLTALDSPVAYGAVKEMARYAPLELTRLGVGMSVAPQEDWGNLFADVGLSTLLTGAGGSLLGFLKAGGTKAADVGRIAGSDLAFKPTFSLRMGLDEGAQTTGELGLSETNQKLLREVLSERPENKMQYVAPLEGATPESNLGINTLFRAQSSAAKDPELDKRTLEIATGDTDMRRISPEKQTEVLAAAGFSNVEDMASTLVYPRLISVKTQRAAGALAKILDDNPALGTVGDGVLMGREAESGLWVTAKRIRSGTATDGAKAFGKTGIAEGDEWLIGKTDKPQRMVPEAHKVAESNVAQWAKYSEAYRPQRADIFNRDTDAMLQAVSPGDYRDARVLNKSTFVARKTEELAKKFGEITGLKGSETFSRMAAAIHDVIAPTMFKEADSPLFSRFFSLLRNNMRVADSHVNQMLPEISELYHGLTAEERNLVARAATTQTPADDLAKLSHDGTISQNAQKAVARLQEINKQFLDEVVVPGLESAGLKGKFDFLEGYILPRVFKGDWQVEVKNEKGLTQWLSVGKTPAAAKAEADAVVKEAESRGLKWQRTDAADHAAEFASDDINRISELVTERMAQSSDAHDVVVAAMQRLAAARAGKAQPIPVKRALGTFKERTGVAGSPDLHDYSAQDLMKATEAHYKQLAKFVGYHTWRERWLPEAQNLAKMDPSLYKDLLRKGSQFMGIPGEITKVQDNALKPLLGTVLGNKPATRIAQAVNSTLYAWNIGIANPTFAVLNLLQPLQTVAPWVSYVTGVAPEYAAKMMQFIPKYAADGRPRGQLGFFHPMKVLGQATKMLRDTSPEIKAVYERAKLDGTIAAQLHDDWIGGYSKNALSLKETFQKEGGWEFIKKLSTTMATKSEEYSRMISFNAGYLVGRDHFGLEGDALYRFARRATEVTMYNYSVVDRPRMFTGPIGSMFGLFKNWQFHFIGQMAEYAGVGMKQGVFGPMLWQGGAALALGGLGATPLKMMADGLANYYGDAPSSYLWMQEHWGSSADEIYFGLPAFLGVSLQASATVPGTDVRNEIGNMMNVVAWERAKAIGKAVGDAWQLGSSADMNALRNPNVRDELAAALLPRAAFKAISVLEGDYVKSMTTGMPQARDLSPSARILTGLGLNQVQVERQNIASKELYADQQAMRYQVQGLGTAYAEAQLNNDWDEMERVVQRTIAQGLPLSSVLSSARTRERREAGDQFDRFDAQKVERYKSALGVQ